MVTSNLLILRFRKIALLQREVVENFFNWIEPAE